MRVACQKKLKKITSGVFTSLIDVALFSFSLPFHTKEAGPIEALFKSIDTVKRTNVNSFKRAVYNARHKGYLERKEDYYKITQSGQERLRRLLPKYEEKRSWDGILYLITYDIPEEKKKFREYLRDYLKKLGCGMLQKSVWLTPYNPKKHIIDFVERTGTPGLVLVSELREGSRIGGRDIRDVLAKVYSIKELNEDYRKFAEKVEEKKLKKASLIMEYFSILRKDPQLPFELMRGDYRGDEAFMVYKKFLL